jgi:glucose/arabinose dehydrogenase
LVLSTLPAGFQESFVTGNVFPTSMDFASDGRLFITDKFGSVRIFKNNALLPTPFYLVAVDTYSDRGMNSVSVDPNFATNHFVYLQYTAAVPGNPNLPNNGAITKVVRVTADPANLDVALAGSEVTLIDNIPTPAGQHLGGFMHFSTDGMLYVGIGMGENPPASQDLTNVFGKILRLDVHNYPNIIPADNPYVGTAGARGEIWATGFRNPFSGDIDKTNGTIYVNDVGATTWEEVNSVVKGGNFGWPNVEGPSQDPKYINPVMSYNHNGGGAAATGGAFYHANNFPASYSGHYFVGDVAQNVIRAFDPADGQVDIFATDVGFITDIDVAPDGSLYYASVGPQYAGIFRINYAGGSSTQPTAIAKSDVIAGLSPLTVHFDGSSSANPSGAALSYSWDLGDGTTVTGVNPVHTYSVNGQYTVILTVTDTAPGGLSSRSFPTTITVGNRLPVPTILTPIATTTYQSGQTMTFSGSATDPDDGTLPASAYHWSFLFGHNTHFHSFIAPIDGVTTGQFTIPTGGESSPDQYYRIMLTVTDSGGLQKTVIQDIRPQLVNFTLTTNIVGAVVNLEGQPQTTPATISGVVGMIRQIEAPSPQVVNGQTYYFDGWSDGGASAHAITTPAVATTYTALYHLANPNLVAQISATPPSHWIPNQGQTYNVTVTNQGTTTWLATGVNATHLGIYFDGKDDAVGSWTVEPQRFSLPSDVAPGQTVSVAVSLPAPATIGQLILRHRMVTEGVAWFDQVQKFNVLNGRLGVDISVTTPLYWQTGGTADYDLFITNQDDHTWVSTGTNAVKLGVYFDATSDTVGAWPSEPIRVSLPQDIVQGQTIRIPLSIAAPLTAGTHSIRYRLVQEGVTWSDQVTMAPFTAGTLASSFVGTAPPVFNTGEAKAFNLSITNTGTVAWTVSGPNPTLLGVYWDATSDAPFTWAAEPDRVSLPGDVQPGQTVTVSIPVTAPLSPGVHVLRARLVTEGQNWFNSVFTANVSVGTLVATYTLAPPTVWELGQTQTYNLTVTNSGNAVWNSTGALAVQVGAYFGGASDTPSNAVAPPVLVNLPSDVAPGQTVTVPISITAPKTVGAYSLRTRMVLGSGVWFANFDSRAITQPALGATYVSTPPTTWNNNQSRTYSITVTNVGTQTWNVTGANIVQLGVYFGTSNDAVGAWTTSPRKYSLPVNVAAGQSATFNITVTAPSASGSYVLRHRFAYAGTNWFTDQLKTNVIVGIYTATYTATPSTTWTAGQAKTFSVTVTNTGNVTWNATGADAVHLAVYFGGASDAVGAWSVDPIRFNLPKDLAPGQRVTISVTMTAPLAKGSYILRLRMVKEGLPFWFTDMKKTNVTVI